MKVSGGILGHLYKIDLDTINLYMLCFPDFSTQPTKQLLYTAFRTKERVPVWLTPAASL
jgi:hypothetical protein